MHLSLIGQSKMVELTKALSATTPQIEVALADPRWLLLLLLLGNEVGIIPAGRADRLSLLGSGGDWWMVAPGNEVGIKPWLDSSASMNAVGDVLHLRQEVELLGADMLRFIECAACKVVVGEKRLLVAEALLLVEAPDVTDDVVAGIVEVLRLHLDVAVFPARIFLIIISLRRLDLIHADARALNQDRRGCQRPRPSPPRVLQPDPAAAGGRRGRRASGARPLPAPGPAVHFRSSRDTVELLPQGAAED